MNELKSLIIKRDHRVQEIEFKKTCYSKEVTEWNILLDKLN